MKSTHKERFDKICEFISKKDMERMLNGGYSFGMIRDMLLREYPEILNEDILASTMSTASQFWRIMKSSGLNVNNDLYLKKPQWWKIQYRFPKDCTIEEIKNKSKLDSIRGQKITIEKRRVNGTLGNPKFKREDSPLCLEFYSSRGISEAVARQEVQKICSKGAISAMAKCGQNVVSGLELRFADILDELSIEYKQQEVIELNEAEREYNYYNHSYDFRIGNTLLEVHGTYYHADPRFFKGTDRVHDKPVQIVWDKDESKTIVANSRGLKYVCFWEFDINYRESEVRKRLISLFS